MQAPILQVSGRKRGHAIAISSQAAANYDNVGKAPLLGRDNFRIPDPVFLRFLYRASCGRSICGRPPSSSQGNERLGSEHEERDEQTPRYEGNGSDRGRRSPYRSRRSRKWRPDKACQVRLLWKPIAECCDGYRASDLKTSTNWAERAISLQTPRIDPTFRSGKNRESSSTNPDIRRLGCTESSLSRNSPSG